MKAAQSSHHLIDVQFAFCYESESEGQFGWIRKEGLRPRSLDGVLGYRATITAGID